MANEISHPPRELAVLVVRRVGVVSVIVPAGPSRKKGRKEGRSVLFHPRWKGRGGCKTRKQDGDRTLAFSLHPRPRLFTSFQTGVMGAASCSGWRSRDQRERG